MTRGTDTRRTEAETPEMRTRFHGGRGRGTAPRRAGGAGAPRVTRRGADPKKPFAFENAVAEVSFSAVSVAENDLDELKSFAVVK